MPTMLRSRLTKVSSRVTASSAERSLDTLARKGLDAFFVLAPALSRPQLVRAIKLVRSVQNYSRRDELLERLNKYLAQHSKYQYPGSLKRELRRPRARFKGVTGLRLAQLLAQLSPNEQRAVLDRTLLRLEIQIREGTKSRKVHGAASKPARKAAKGGGGSLEGLIRRRRQLLGRPAPPKKIGGGGKGGHGSPGGIAGHSSSRPMNLSPPLSADVEEPEGFVRTLIPRKPKSAKKKSALKPKPPKSVVSTGFAAPSQAAKPIKPTSPLKAGEKYYFWLQVGERVSGSIEIKDEELPTKRIPRQAILDVVLFAGKDGLKLIPGSDAGKLRLVDEVVTVESQPTKIPLSDASDDPSLLEQRLFFPVVAPNETGNYRLRCNIYYRTVLVQSRTVNAYVMRRPQTR